MENFKLYHDYDEKNNLRIVKEVENFDDFKKTIIVFRNSPYCEILSNEEIKEEYNYYKNNGIILGCYFNGKIAGVNCIYNGSQKEHSITFHDDDKVAYYSGFAVNPNYRGKGIGKLLIYQTDKYLSNLRLYNYSYARIMYKGSMSEGIFRQNGFEDAYYNNELIIDKVKYKRNDATVSDTDERKYMVKTMNNKGHGWYSK